MFSRSHAHADINDALSNTVNGNPNGLSIKTIASSLWPSRNPETARNVLSRAINPEYPDVNLDPEETVSLMRITQNPEPILFFLCDAFGYERPKRKDLGAFETAIQFQIENLSDQLRSLTQNVQQLSRFRQVA